MLLNASVTKLNLFIFHPNVYYLNHPSVLDCLGGKWTDCVIYC